MMAYFQSVKNVLVEMTNPGAAATTIRQNGGVLLNAIEARQSRRQEITTEEMRAILEDRDLAMAKVKRIIFNQLKKREN